MVFSNSVYPVYFHSNLFSGLLLFLFDLLTKFDLAGLAGLGQALLAQQALLGPGQALGKLAHFSFFRQVASKRCIFEQL